MKEEIDERWKSKLKFKLIDTSFIKTAKLWRRPRCQDLVLDMMPLVERGDYKPGLGPTGYEVASIELHISEIGTSPTLHIDHAID